MDHDFERRWVLGTSSRFETDDADVILAAGDFNKAQMIAGAGELVGAGESTIADHHDAIGAAAFEKRVGEKNGVLYAPRRIARLQAARQFPQPALIRCERHEQARLRAGSDHHHFLSRSEAVDQREPLAPRRIEA